MAGCSSAQADLSDITLYQTTAITADPEQPLATGIAVRDGRISTVGDFRALSQQLHVAALSNEYADKVLLPGLINPYVHMTLGAMMYGADMVPPWDVPMPDGNISGLTNWDALSTRIAEIEENAPDGPLMLWGYHDLIQGDVWRADLDALSANRPILLWHWSGHDFHLNSAVIDMAGATSTLAEQFHGIEPDHNGELTGRIYENALLAIFEQIAAVILHPDHIQT